MANNKNDDSVSLVELLKNAIDSHLVELHTAMIGKVVSYNSSEQTADIKLLVKKIFFDDREAESQAILPSVPVAHFRTSDAYIHVPLATGDYVLVIFCERSIDKAMVDGTEVDPEDVRKHNLSDGIAIPFNIIQSQQLSLSDPTALTIVNKGTEFLLKDGSTTINSNVTINGNLTVSGNESVGGNSSIGGNNTVTGSVQGASVTALGAVAGASMSVGGKDVGSHTHTPGTYTAPAGGGLITGDSGGF